MSEERTSRRGKFDAALSLALLFAVAAVVVGGRLTGPVDLYEKDQPKTLAYTADVVLNGRWALPRDVLFQPATKPPLYNWLAAVGVIAGGGSWSEFVLKWPSLAGGLGVAALLVAMGRRFDPTGHRARGTAVGALAAALWLTFGSDVRHGSAIRLLYLCRPDMLQAFFLTAAWACATAMLVGSTRRRWTWASGFWACVAAAAMTKGPMALLPVAYLVVAGVVTRRWRAIVGWHLLVGPLAVIAVVGLWLGAAVSADARHLREVILGAEILDRVSAGSPEGTAHPWHRMATWFLTKGAPWSGLAAIGLGMALARLLRQARSANGEGADLDPLRTASALWLAILLVALTVPAGKRIDYLLPAWPPAAVLAALVLARVAARFRMPTALLLVLPLACGGWLARQQHVRFHEAVHPHSGRAAAFARDVLGATSRRDPLLVLVRGKHPLTTLLGRHPGSFLTPRDLRSARWVVLPVSRTSARPVLTSLPLPVDFETVTPLPTEALGLYDLMDESRPTDDELREAVLNLAHWSREENPYRAAGTVWREEP